MQKINSEYGRFCEAVCIKLFLTLALLLTLVIPSFAAISTTITANNTEDSLSIDEGTDVTVAISLYHSEPPDLNVDYWALIQADGGFYHLNLSTGYWDAGIETTYQGPIINLSEYPIFQGHLPAGEYIGYFGVDTVMNGQLDMEDIQYDRIGIAVSNPTIGSVEIKKSYTSGSPSLISGDSIVVNAVVEGTNFTPAFTWTLEGPDGESLELNMGSMNVFSYPVYSVGEYTLSVKAYDISDQGTFLSAAYSFSVIDPTVIEGTILSRDTTISVDNSPYKIDGTIQIPDGVTLTIDPGVEIYGGLIIAWGTLNMVGDYENRILLNNVSLDSGFRGNGAKINISFADIYISNKSFLSNYFAEYSIYDSVFYGCYFIVSQSNEVSTFERNTFVDTSIFVEAQNGEVIVRNNNFIGNSGIRLGFGGRTITIEKNNFITNEEKAVSFNSNCDLETLNVSNNYWGTTDLNLIDEMIYDHNDFYGIFTTADYFPILSIPDRLTPDSASHMQ